MTTVIVGVVIFLEIVQYLVFFDVILSWLTLIGVRFRPRFLAAIIDPLYRVVNKYIPTTFGAFNFTPIIVIFGIMILNGIIVMTFPGVSEVVQSIPR